MSLISRTAKSRTAGARATGLGGPAARAAAVACMAFAASAFSSLAAAPAHADPGICIDHVMENGYEATAEVLRACKIAKTGEAEDFAECLWILDDEDVANEVAVYACEIASYPDPEQTSS